MNIYPQLTSEDFIKHIELADDGDGKGAYIRRWDVPGVEWPTPTQLEAASDILPPPSLEKRLAQIGVSIDELKAALGL